MFSHFWERQVYLRGSEHKDGREPQANNRVGVTNIAHHTGTRRRSRPNGAHRGGLGQVNSAGRDVAEYNLERKRTSSTSSAGLLKRRAVDTYPRYGWARPGHACLWTDILNPL